MGVGQPAARRRPGPKTRSGNRHSTGMDSAASEKSIIALDGWLQSPAGAYVRAWEQRCLDELTADIFGFNALQIGLPQIDALAANRMPNKWRSATRTSTREQLALSVDASQIADTLAFAELPFASQSVERVLIPEGQLIICGFNPASLWGMRQAMGRAIHSPYLPSAGEFISMPRMKDWLKLLNLGVSRSHFGCYAPPCRSAKWLQRFHFLEEAGQKGWPYLGAVYMVHAIKRVKGGTIIGPAWNRKTAGAPKAVPATNRK